jgi:hypothetical protein
MLVNEELRSGHSISNSLPRTLTGNMSRKVAPESALGVAHDRSSCVSTIERLGRTHTQTSAFLVPWSATILDWIVPSCRFALFVVSYRLSAA